MANWRMIERIEAELIRCEPWIESLMVEIGEDGTELDFALIFEEASKPVVELPNDYGKEDYC